jgi:hypothetical protein
MISRETIEALEQEERGWQYILGARMRSQAEVKDEVLSRAGRYRVVHPGRVKSDDPSPLKVKEVRVEGRRYIVCLNEDEARKDAADRAAIVAALREQLRRGDKALVGNKGYRRYLGAAGPEHFRIDEAKVAEDARYDGKWVLRTDTDLDSAEVALQYKQLWMVEVCQADDMPRCGLYPSARWAHSERGGAAAPGPLVPGAPSRHRRAAAMRSDSERPVPPRLRAA